MKKPRSLKSSILEVLLAPALILLAGECVARLDILGTLIWIVTKPHLFLLGYALLASLSAILFSAFKRPAMSTTLIALITILMAGLNAGLCMTREHPMLPITLVCGIDFIFMMFRDWMFAIGLPCAFAAVAAIIIIVKKLTDKRRPEVGKKTRLVSLAAGIAVFALSFMLCTLLPVNEKNIHAQIAENGYTNTFTQYLTIPAITDIGEKEKPDYEVAEAQGNTPDIIVLKLESFSDGADYESITPDVTPNLHRAASEGLSGTVLTTAFGGNTCSSCFEVLTGYSAAFTTASTSCYGDMLLFAKEQKSLTGALKEQGYASTYYSCCYPEFTHEKGVSKLLGFDSFVDESQFDYSAANVPDKMLAERIISDYEKRDKSKPVLMAALTMENHFTFDPDNYDVLDYDYQDNDMFTPAENRTLRGYFNGLNDDDELIGTLMDYFANVENEVDIVMFADHRPILGSNLSVYKKLGFIPEDFRYETATEKDVEFLNGSPYVIWNNKGQITPERTEKPLAPAYLLPMLFEQRGIKGNDVSDFLIAAKEVVPNYGTASFKLGEYDREYTDYYHYLCHRDVM